MEVCKREGEESAHERGAIKAEEPLLYVRIELHTFPHDFIYFSANTVAGELPQIPEVARDRGNFIS